MKQATKERPILFSTEMVRAIQEGRKTQTRRIIKGISPEKQHNMEFHANVFPQFIFSDLHDNAFHFTCPYGKPGDVLWVREKWRPLIDCKTGESSVDFYAEMPDAFHKQYPNKWKPSIHMLKAASRIWLRITNVRVERLMDIKREDAKAEGIKIDSITGTKFHNYVDGTTTYNERTSFYSLWESINGKESLDSNPWVWVVEFERIEKP